MICGMRHEREKCYALGNPGKRVSLSLSVAVARIYIYTYVRLSLAARHQARPPFLSSKAPLYSLWLTPHSPSRDLIILSLAYTTLARVCCILYTYTYIRHTKDQRVRWHYYHRVHFAHLPRPRGLTLLHTHTHKLACVCVCVSVRCVACTRATTRKCESRV